MTLIVAPVCSAVPCAGHDVRAGARAGRSRSHRPRRVPVVRSWRDRGLTDSAVPLAVDDRVLDVAAPTSVGHRTPRILVGVGSPPVASVCAPRVDVRVSRARTGQPVDNRLRLLRRRGVVQPDQRPAVHPPRKERKVRPHRVDHESRIARARRCQTRRRRAGRARWRPRLTPGPPGLDRPAVAWPAGPGASSTK